MGVGMEVGTFVHTVLEEADFAAPDLGAELAARVAQAGSRRSTAVGDPAVVADGLRAALQTPLGPLLDGLRLCDVARADRLDELVFELPLAGGDECRAAAASSRRRSRRCCASTCPPATRSPGYAQRLADPALRGGVRGYLTGTIDLVVRAQQAGEQRFAIVDYKTNWLAPPGEELSAWHHRPAALAVEMQRYHYGLQALLYTAALHRYLRWRVPGYDPERNLAGVLYLFLRGMTGEATPLVDGAPCGVFAWRPPPALVMALSDVLDRGGAR